MWMLYSRVDSERTARFPSGEIPNDSVTQSGSKPANLRRVAEVSRPKTKSWT